MAHLSFLNSKVSSVAKMVRANVLQAQGGIQASSGGEGSDGQAKSGQQSNQVSVSPYEILCQIRTCWSS